MATDEAKQLYRLRGQSIEIVFADFKEHRNLRRFSGGGLQRARGEVAGLVLCHNLLLLRKNRQARENAATQVAEPGEIGRLKAGRSVNLVADKKPAASRLGQPRAEVPPCKS